MSADDRRRKIALISWWPFIDASAFFVVLMELPNRFMVLVCLGFLYWKRRSLQLPWQFAAAVLTALMLYSHLDVWHFIYTFAVSVVAASAAGSNAWLANAAYLTAITAAFRVILRLPPRDPLPPPCSNRFFSPLLKSLLIQVLSAASSNLFMQIVQDKQDDLPKRSRRLATLKSRQPIWTLLAMAFYQLRTEEEPAAPSVVVCFVEEHLVGLKVSGGEQPIKVDGIEWAQVYWENDLLVIYGLAAATTYNLELGDMMVVFSTEVGSEGGSSQRKTTPLFSLQEAFQAAEASLSEEKLRLRKMKKDQTKRLTALRQDIAAVAERQERSNKADERIRRKVQSLQDQVRQLRQEIAEIDSSEQELSQRRPEATAAYAVREREWNEKRVEHERIQKQLRDLSAEKASELRDLHAQVVELEARALTLKTKSEGLANEASEISQATELAVRAMIDSRAENRKAKQQRRIRQEEEFLASIEKLEQGVAEMQQRAELVTQAADAWSNDWS